MANELPGGRVIVREAFEDVFVLKVVPKNLASLVGKLAEIPLFKQVYVPDRDIVETTETKLKMGICYEEYCLIRRTLLPAVLSLARLKGIEVELSDRLKPKPLLPEPEEEVKLRPYQQEALSEWEKAGHVGTIVAPTGAGKTWIALAGIAKLRLSTLILVPTIELAHQWAERLEKLFPGNVGLFYGDRKEVKPITIATYQSAYRYAEKLSNFNFLVSDEVHHLPAEKWKEIAIRFKGLYRMGLSATVKRKDGNHRMIYRLIGYPIYQVRYEELTPQYLAPLELHVWYGEPSRSEYGVLAQLEADYKRLRGLSSRTATIKSQLIKFARTAKWKTELLPQLIHGKTLVFTEYVDHAKHVHQRLLALGFKAGLILGETDKRSRLQQFNDFRNGRVQVLVTTKVLDEGVDVPDAQTVIILGFESPRQLIQRIGRVLRPKPKAYAHILITYPFETRYARYVRQAVEEAGWEGVEIQKHILRNPELRPSPREISFY